MIGVEVRADQSIERAARVLGLSHEGTRRLVVGMHPEPYGWVRMDGSAGSPEDVDLLVVFGRETAKSWGHRGEPLSCLNVEGLPVVWAKGAHEDASVEQAIARSVIFREMDRLGYLGRMRPRDLAPGPDGGDGELLPVSHRAPGRNVTSLCGDSLALWQWLVFLTCHSRPINRDDEAAFAAWAEVDRQAMIMERTTGQTVETITLDSPSLFREAAARARASTLGFTIPKVAKGKPPPAWSRSTVEVLTPILMRR